MALVNKRRKNQATAHRAFERDVATGDTVQPSEIAARLVNLLEIAVVGVQVAELPALSRRVQRLQALVVKLPHFVHAAEAHRRQHRTALVPERLVHRT